MKRIVLSILTAVLVVSVYGQELSVDDFLEFSSNSSRKMENMISKKGFIPSGKIFQNDTIIDTWQQALRLADSTKPQVSRRIAKYQNGKEVYYSIQTSSQDEYKLAVNKLKQEGFVTGKENFDPSQSLLLQKRNITIQGSSVVEDSLSLYTLFFQEKAMPSAKSVVYGNDLLQFTSHEILTGFFGGVNVKKDLYYFSKKEMSKCSVLFPNTPRQAIFIWEDQENMTGLSHIIIGGTVRTASSANFNRQVVENTWRLDNGIRFNMRLEELLKLNNQDLSFYGRNSEYFLTVAPKSQGDLDLSSTCIILDCINCDGASILDKPLIQASDAIDQDLRLHVGMIILMPPSSTNIVSKYARR